MTEAPPPEPAEVGVRRRRGGRDAQRTARSATNGPQQLPWAQPRMIYEPTRAVSDDELEAIHLASLTVLRDIGIEVLEPTAQKLLVQAGATMKPGSDKVFLDPDMVLEKISTAPSEFTLHARNPDRDVRLGGNWVSFGSVASTPNASDIPGDRRTGNHVDFKNLVRLSHVLNAVHFHGGYPVEPVDLHASVRHLHATWDLLTLSDKPIHAYSLGRQRNIDCLEMIRIARGVSHEELDAEPSIYSIINANSPLRLDTPMLQGILEFSARNQAIVITPFTLAGAMAPVTIAGAVVQQNAEALAGIVLTQVVRAGAPVVYGGFTSNVDMKSGAPAFGTPEYMQSALLGGQLARRYEVPYRSSGVNAANSLDAQSAYESVFSLWGAIMGGANMVFHAAGWMEGGLRASMEKMVIDADLLQMVSSFLTPLGTSSEDLALDAIAEVGPGGHYFGTAHTQERYKDAFYSPLISDWRNFETWDEAGRPTADQKAQQLVGEFLDAHADPVFDSERRAELEDFVSRRVSEGGIKTDF